MKTEIIPLPKQAIAAAIKSVCDNHEKLESTLQDVSKGQIKAVNFAYQIGLSLQELSGRDQIKLTLFEKIKAELPAGLSYKSASKFVHLANKMKGPVKTLAEAHEVMQEVFNAGGFLELKHRETAQISHEEAPATLIFRVFGTAKEQIKKRISGVKSWDEATKQGVRDVIGQQRKFLDEIEDAL